MRSNDGEVGIRTYNYKRICSFVNQKGQTKGGGDAKMQQFSAKHPWAILAAGAAIQVLTGLPAAWGVFQQPVMDEYGLSEQGAG